MIDPTKILSARGTRTQRQFADLLGVQPLQVSRWERGEAQPDIVSLAALSQVSGQPMEWFLQTPVNDKPSTW